MVVKKILDDEKQAAGRVLKYNPKELDEKVKTTVSDQQIN